MVILTWIILGGIAGWLASMLMGTNAQQGILGNIVVGIIGALLGGFVFSLFSDMAFTGFNFTSLFVALVGSVILLWVLKMFRGHGHHHA